MPADPASQAKPLYQERTYRAGDGLELFYRRYGRLHHDTPALLFLGGLTRNSKDFHRLAKRYADATFCLAPDYRGRGRSAFAPDPQSYRPEVYLDDIRHLLAIEGVHRVIVVGTSLGGLLAMGLAVTQPTVLAGAVLNDIGPDIHFPALEPIKDFMRDVKPLPDWHAAVQKLQKFFPDFPASDPETWEAIARATWKETEAGIVFDFDPAILEPIDKEPEPSADLWALFRALKPRPVLCLRGGKSDLFTEQALAAMLADRPDMKAVVIEGVGHTPSLAEPEALEALDDFIKHF